MDHCEMFQNHHNLHTGKRPYTCPFCSRTFANGSNCRSHKRRMHPEELRLYEAALTSNGNTDTVTNTNSLETETGNNAMMDSQDLVSKPKWFVLFGSFIVGAD